MLIGDIKRAVKSDSSRNCRPLNPSYFRERPLLTEG